MEKSQNILKAKGLLKTLDESKEKEFLESLRKDASIILENLSDVLIAGFTALSPSPDIVSGEEPLSTETKEKIAIELVEISSLYRKYVESFMNNTNSNLTRKSK